MLQLDAESKRIFICRSGVAHSRAFLRIIDPTPHTALTELGRAFGLVENHDCKEVAALLPLVPLLEDLPAYSLSLLSFTYVAVELRERDTEESRDELLASSRRLLLLLLLLAVGEVGPSQMVGGGGFTL